jgi:hypothetical protein
MITTYREALRERLAEATTHDNKQNYWPNKLEVVRLQVLDHRSPEDMYEAGYLMSRSLVDGCSRGIYASEFSHKVAGYDNEDRPLVEVRRLLPPDPYGHQRRDTSLIHVYFALAGARGQEDDAERRNIYALFPPPNKYVHVHKEMRFVGHGLIVEIGCKHEYSDAGSDHTRGYHIGECKRCGHKYMIDSSD